MELIRQSEIPVLTTSGIVSRQLLFPENSASKRVTITEVTVPVGGISPRHLHENAEQIWVAVRGSGNLLLAEDEAVPFQAGDVARFAEGDVHGFHNTGSEPFTYLSMTSPPVNFWPAYGHNWDAAVAREKL